MFLLIYNLSGVLIGLAGVIVGAFATSVGGRPLGLLLLAVVWFALGLWWRNRPTTSGERRAFPALFFIPLPVWAVPIAFIGAYGLLTRSRTNDRERYRAQLVADLDALHIGPATGDSVLSPAVSLQLRANLPPTAKPEQISVRTRTKQEAVLVLLRVPNLDAYDDEARARLLDLAAGTVSAHPLSRGKQVYVGVTGPLGLSVVRDPLGRTVAADHAADSVLFLFYAETGRPRAT
jgi:hypothetical protein